jgi:hypothetical protein
MTPPRTGRLGRRHPRLERGELGADFTNFGTSSYRKALIASGGANLPDIARTSGKAISYDSRGVGTNWLRK